MQSPSGHTIPRLAEVMRAVKPIPPDMPVMEVAAVFQGNPSLLMIPVCGATDFEGVISRRELFSRHLARQYAKELYGKKAISLLMNTQPITMAPETDVNSALACLLEQDPDLDTDSFPILSHGHFVGLVHVSELIMAISKAQAGLLETLEVLSARIRDEVDKARQIQQGLLPASAFRFAGLALDAVLINSTEISGDFYDYFVIDENRLGVMVGDVSGHGVQSGMVTTAAKAGLHLLLDRGVNTPGELLAGMNRAVLATASSSLLMTAVVAVVDLAAHKVSLANAGHNYPFLYRAATGETAMLDGTGGFPLGFDAGSEYAELEVGFRSGDRLLLYTDGIIEARNSEGEEYGYERFEAYLQRTLGGPPEPFRRGLVAAVQQFSGSKGFEDDVTILVVADETTE